MLLSALIYKQHNNVKYVATQTLRNKHTPFAVIIGIQNVNKLHKYCTYKISNNLSEKNISRKYAKAVPAMSSVQNWGKKK